MTHGSLFSGIGGFDLAAQWMGWENKFHCELNYFGQQVLKYYWPDAELFKDIKTTDFTKYANRIDVLTGGFPCQPYSNAGKREGKADERHLWPEMLRAIKEISPRWIVGENVRGLTNWNDGLVFHEVCSDLENLGYEVSPYLIPASSTNAPHKRERIWFIAYRNCASAEHSVQTGRNLSSSQSCNGNASYTNSIGCNEYDRQHGEQSIDRRINAFNDANQDDGEGFIADSNSTSSQCRNSQATKEWEKQRRRVESFCEHTGWEVFPTQPPICGGNDGLPTKLDGITFPKWRKESIKAYGNAVVPQVVYEIFKTIEQYESLHNA